MHSSQNKIRIYYARYTQSAEDRGKKDEQKRLREALDSRLIHLRFDHLINRWQVWYDAPNSGLYCIMNLDWPLEIAQAIYLLKGRQKTPRELMRICDAQTEYNEKRMQSKIDDLADQMADGLYSHAVGKVTASFKQ